MDTENKVYFGCGIVVILAALVVVGGLLALVVRLLS